MLSYSHAFHAGNHADVLKHLTLVTILQRMQIKPKPLFFMDTHAGSGLYSLLSKEAKKNDEANTGILKLNLDATKKTLIAESSALSHYLTLCESYKKKMEYPGSPLVANSLLREEDKAFAYELHPQAFNELQQNCRGTKVNVQKRNGLEAMVAMLPPTPKRGLVLIDPPYENVEEYQDIVLHLKKAIQRWAIGTFAIWYPILSPTRLNRTSLAEENNPKARQADILRKACSELNVKSVLDIQFCPTPASKELGMYGSGMLVLNAPWQFEEQIKEAMTLLVENTELCASDASRGNEHLALRSTWLKSE